MTCSLETARHFKGTYHLCLQGQRIIPARSRLKQVASWAKHVKHQAWYRPVKVWKNCQTVNVRMTIFCKGTERDPLDTKEMVPRLGPERADCMLSEGRCRGKLYVCLCPHWEYPGDLCCRFIVTWFSKQNSQVFSAASCSCYPCPRHKYDFSPILTSPEMQLSLFRTPPGYHFLQSNCLIPLETIDTHPQAPLQLLWVLN
jgi:hypothetical protein